MIAVKESTAAAVPATGGEGEAAPKPTLLILAAGLGSRYGGCKQIAPVGPNQEIVLDYSLYDAWQSGFGKVVMVVRKELREWLENHLRSRWQDRLLWHLVDQELDDLPVPPPDAARLAAGRTKPWGTGHAVWVAREAVNEPFAMVNADDFYGRETFQLLADFLIAEAGWKNVQPPVYALAGYRLGATLSPHGPVSRGVCQVENQNNWLRNIEEVTGIRLDRQGRVVAAETERAELGLRADACVSLNAWAFTPSLFAQLQEKLQIFLAECGDLQTAEFYLPTAVADLIRGKRCLVRVVPTPANWFGLTYRADHELVRRHILQLVTDGIYPERLD